MGDVVHGGIRHLETENLYRRCYTNVHGGIRHLENEAKKWEHLQDVHGGIRHLENVKGLYGLGQLVHGGIRHLEIWMWPKQFIAKSSWRHTPFRKQHQYLC